jgi:DNA-binding NtrC family response regulator
MKGSFTDAKKDRAGYFEAADGGTIFLDEIGELPKAAQVKMLRVLAEGKVTRLGSTTPKEVDVRIIAATNRTLSTEVLEGRFREDLYYRLAVVIIRIPPVRKREGDVGMLIDKLLEKQNKESAELGLQTKVLSPAARNTLLKYPWPGNVRELQNTLVRVSVLSTGSTIGVEDVRDALSLAIPNNNEQSLLNQPLGDGFNLRKLMSQLASHYLERASQETHGNKKKAAQLLGFPNYQTFDNWIKKHKVTLKK